MKNSDIEGSYVYNKYKPRDYDAMDYSDVTKQIFNRNRSPN